MTARLATALNSVRMQALRLDGSDREYDALPEMVGERTFILLGEAPHGAREFYQMRADITRRLILSLISVQQQHVQAMMHDRLREQFVHSRAGPGIDVATADAAHALEELARATLRNADMDQLDRRFLRRTMR